MKTSPTQRSKLMLTQKGYNVAIVERWNPHVGIRQDLFGFGDLLAIYPSDDLLRRRIVLVQTTTGANMAARVTKILAEPRAKHWLHAGGEIVVHGWRKVGARGKRKLWECREQEITLEDFQVADAAHRAEDQGAELGKW